MSIEPGPFRLEGRRRVPTLTVSASGVEAAALEDAEAVAIRANESPAIIRATPPTLHVIQSPRNHLSTSSQDRAGSSQDRAGRSFAPSASKLGGSTDRRGWTDGREETGQSAKDYGLDEDRTASIEPPERSYDCKNYETCLSLAAALNWSSFTCTGCSGCVNEQLLWRAHHSVRNNPSLSTLCDLPNLAKVSDPDPTSE
ncbi:MAG: hypothetical protein U0136_10285 [Bdellovibrionota bacterium]